MAPQRAGVSVALWQQTSPASPSQAHPEECPLGRMVLPRVRGARAVLSPGGCGLLPGKLPQESPATAAKVEGRRMSGNRQRPGPTGAELKAARKFGGLSQTELGAKAGISRHAISYWESRSSVDPRGWAVQRMAQAEPRIQALFQAWVTNTRGRGMGVNLPFVLPVYSGSNARARDGSYRPSALDALLAEANTHVLSVMKEKEAQRRARLRVICGARTTRKGTPCRNKSEPGRKRCKFHGGRSTGPKSAEGRERIAEAQRTRWAKWRDRQYRGAAESLDAS